MLLCDHIIFWHRHFMRPDFSDDMKMSFGLVPVRNKRRWRKRKAVAGLN